MADLECLTSSDTTRVSRIQSGSKMWHFFGIMSVLSW